MNKPFFSFFSYLTLVLIVPTIVSSQTRPSQPPNLTSSPQPPDTNIRPDSIEDGGTYVFWSRMSNQGRTGGALLGKVRVEGDALLWEPILVSISCQNKVVNTTGTDPRGDFAFTSVPGVVSAQADAGREMKTYYEGCRVEASLTGFRSDALTITERNLLDEPNLGTIWLHSANKEATGTALSVTTVAVPKKAEKLFDKAHTAMLERNPERAKDSLEEAVRVYPDFAEAWYQLGKLQMNMKLQGAQESFSKSAHADPQFVLPYVELAQMATEQQKWDEVLANTNRALQLDPSGSRRIWYFSALANYQLSRLEPAKASAVKALEMDPAHEIVHIEQLLAIILARQGDYKGAVEHLQNCLTYVKAGPNETFLREQIAQFEHAMQTKTGSN